MEAQKIPNPVLIIILGILGLICCCFWGAGIIPAAIALNLSQKAEYLMAESPELYIEQRSTVRAGKIIAIVAIAANLYFIVDIAFQIYRMGGWDPFWQDLMEKSKEMQKQLEGI